jgi:hypothetical protein
MELHLYMQVKYGKMVDVLLVGPTCWFAGSTPSIQFCVRQCMSKGFWLEAVRRVCRVRGWLKILPYFTYPPHSSTKFMDFALLFPLCNSIATGFRHFSAFHHFLCFPNARSTKACPSECPFAAELADPTKCRGENVGGLIVMHLSLSVSLSSLVGQHSVKAHSVPPFCSSIS